MKNLLKFSFVFAFLFVASVCFSQTQSDTSKSVKQSEKKTQSSDKKGKKSDSPIEKEKNAGTTEKIAVTDHGKPADKSSNKKNEDKAVVPKKD